MPTCLDWLLPSLLPETWAIQSVNLCIVHRVVMVVGFSHRQESFLL